MVLLREGVVLNNDYDEAIQKGWAGYAEWYLQQTWNKAKLETEAKPEVYLKLMKLDAELGTTDEQKLSGCCALLADINLINVFKLFQFYLLF